MSVFAAEEARNKAILSATKSVITSSTLTIIPTPAPIQAAKVVSVVTPKVKIHATTLKLRNILPTTYKK